MVLIVRLKTIISNAFVTLKKTQALVNGKINDINSQIKNLQTELENKKAENVPCSVLLVRNKEL